MKKFSLHAGHDAMIPSASFRFFANASTCTTDLSASSTAHQSQQHREEQRSHLLVSATDRSLCPLAPAECHQLLSHGRIGLLSQSIVRTGQIPTEERLLAAMAPDGTVALLVKSCLSLRADTEQGCQARDKGDELECSHPGETRCRDDQTSRLNRSQEDFPGFCQRRERKRNHPGIERQAVQVKVEEDRR